MGKPVPGTVRIDPILASVLQRRLKSITQEMGLTLQRTTRSPILNEARDFVTGLYDAEGRMLEQTEYIPLLAFALQPACKFIIDYFGSELYPGDVILHNDVFTGGNQASDVATFRPIFDRDKLVAWAACKGHQADIGGPVPGGYNPQAREVWQEGLRITPVKIYEGGKFRKDVWDLIFANVRFSMVAEDIRAQIGGCMVGERGIKALIGRHGLDLLEAHLDYLFDSTEKMMRKEISAIPDGVYTGESYMYFDGITKGSKYKVKVTITVKGDEIAFDYAGSDPQAPGYTNAPFTATASGTLLTFLMCINPDIPHNDGMVRPIHIHVPEGSFLNARFPAATNFGNHITEEVADAIFKALAPALPERVTAGWNRFLNAVITGWDPRRGRPFATIPFLGSKGGSGATYGVDGYDYIGAIYCAGGLLGQDYEMFELQGPQFLLQHEYRQDSAGEGRWRGGLGVKSAFRIYGDKIVASVIADGVEKGSEAFGLFGGRPGALNIVEVIAPDGSRRFPQTKEVLALAPGSVIVQEKGGGGGYGDPYERPVEKVEEEVGDELISLERAREVYGVVIDPQSLEADYEKTWSRRGGRGSSSGQLEVGREV